MKIETLKRKLITLALHENLSLDHSEEELKRAIRNAIGKKTTRAVVWPGSDYFAPFTVEAGKTILPHFVHIPTDHKPQSGHPFGCGPNESPDQVLSWLKWAVCVVEWNGERKIPPSPTSWTLYRLFERDEIQEARKSCFLTHRPTYEETLFTALTLATDWWPETSRKYLGRATYQSITRWTCHLASQINPEKTRMCVQHLLDFGIPEIPQALAIATGAFLAGTLFDVNALEDSVEFLLDLEQLIKEKKISINSSDEVTYAFHSFCAFYSLFAGRRGINLALEDLRRFDTTTTGIRIPVITNEFGNFYTLPPACLRVKENNLETLKTLYSYWYTITNKNKNSISPSRWGTAVNTFFNTILSTILSDEEHRNAFLDPILLAKTTARIGVGVKLASSEAIDVVELDVPGSYDDSMLRIFTHDNKQIICWVNRTDALIKGNVEGFSSIKYYNPYFII